MDWLKELQDFFAYELKQRGNGFATECILWNEFGLSVHVQARTAEEAIELAIIEAEKGRWK